MKYTDVIILKFNDTPDLNGDVYSKLCTYMRPKDVLITSKPMDDTTRIGNAVNIRLVNSNVIADLHIDADFLLNETDTAVTSVSFKESSDGSFADSSIRSYIEDDITIENVFITDKPADTTLAPLKTYQVY